ncbi:MAG: hypothetical protein QNJ68_03515 [Microcoleaceae cyanobacterium MO_207.B10]|nr:hypothetical protein [Microcoleaceae cyanobacterium MO_207.B10]
MQVFNPVKVLWDSIKDIPDRLKKLIALTAADGAVFLDENGDYRIVNFGSGAGEIAEGSKYLQLSGGIITGNVNVSAATPSTSTTTGALIVNGGAGISGEVFASKVQVGDLEIGLSLIENNQGNLAIRSYGDNIYIQVFSGNRSIIFQGKDTSNNNVLIAKFNRDSIDLNLPVNIAVGVSGTFTSSDSKTIGVTNGVVTSIS